MCRGEHHLIALSSHRRSYRALSKTSLTIFFAGAVVIAAAMAGPAFGQFYGSGTDDFWSQTNGNNTGFPDGLWSDVDTGATSTADNWNSSNSGSGGTVVLPTSGSDVVFDANDAFNSPTDIRMNVSPVVQGIYINNIGSSLALTTAAAAQTQTITIGADGITMESSSASNVNFGPPVFGTNTWGPISWNLTASQTWANYTTTSRYLEVFGPIAPASGVTTPITLTLTTGGINSYPATSVGQSGSTLNSWLDSAISDGAGPLSLSIASSEWLLGNAGTGEGVLTSPVSTYSGGTTVGSQALVKVVGVSSAGVGPIYVQSGGTFVPDDLEANSNTSYANPVYIAGVGVPVPSGQTEANGFTTFGAILGVNTGGSTNSDSNTLTGGVTLTGNALVTAAYDQLIFSTNPVNLNSNTLTIAGAAASRHLTFNSPIIGSGNVIINSNSGSTIDFVANNTYSGTTTVTSGVLQVGGSGGTNGSGGTGTIVGARNRQYFDCLRRHAELRHHKLADVESIDHQRRHI